jgi:hypothetical protein
MNICPSSVSSLSIVLGGGRNLCEVECFAETASRSFTDYLELASVYYLQGTERSFKQYPMPSLAVSINLTGVGRFGEGEAYGMRLTIIS